MTLNAVADEEGNVHTDPKRMAGELGKHWAKTFARRPIDADKLGRWLDEEFMMGGDGKAMNGLDCTSSAKWRVRRGDVKRAIRLSGWGAPGPDAIP